MNNQVVTVNLVPGLSAPAVVRVSQYDYGRPIVFNILDGTQAATIGSSATITVVGTKPSGLGFSETALTISGGAVTLNTTLAMTQESGLIPAEIRIEEQGSGNIGTANFILAVEKTPHAEGTTDGTQETMQNLEARLQTEIDGLDNRIEALEAGSEGSGLTAQEKSLILTLFSKAAYAEDDAKTAYDTLEGLWRVVYRTITYNLTNCTSSSSVASVENGKPYSTSLSAQSGYTIQTVTVTMGGADVTASVYSNGAISISQVTGDVVITAVASKELSSITATYTQSGTVYDTDTLDSLKSDLVVTANYSDSTSETVTDYTLSGTLAEGTSVVTVSYGGKTATFNVTVSKSQEVPSGYTQYDYLTTTTTAGDYVDTGLVASSLGYNSFAALSTKIKMKLTATPTASTNIIGCRAVSNGTGSTGNYQLFNQTAGTLLAYLLGAGVTTVDIFPTGTVTEINYTVRDGSMSTLTIGNGTPVDVATVNVSDIKSNNKSLLLYGTNRNGTKVVGSTEVDVMELGDITLTNTNGDTVLRFVPAYSDSDAKYGFYETVHGAFYGCKDGTLTGGNWS